MPDTITRAELAQEAAALSSDATGWIHRVMGPREVWGEPTPQELAAQLLMAMQQRLDSIKERSAALRDCAR